VLPERGGTLMIKRLIFPTTTCSRASQISLWWGAGIMSAPFRARNMVLVKVNRSARLSAISLGVIVLAAQRFQDGGAGIPGTHAAIGRGVCYLLTLRPSSLGLQIENRACSVSRLRSLQKAGCDRRYSSRLALFVALGYLRLPLHNVGERVPPDAEIVRDLFEGQDRAKRLNLRHLLFGQHNRRSPTFIFPRLSSLVRAHPSAPKSRA